MTKNRSSNKYNLIADADNDLLSAAVLWKYHLHLSAYYHFAQAIEKYLKVLLIDTDPMHKDDHLPKNSAGNPYITSGAILQHPLLHTKFIISKLNIQIK